MSNEIQVRAGLTVNNGNLQFTSLPGFCVDDQTTPNRATVLVQASVSGTDVNFSPLTKPTWCVIECVGSEASYIEYGIYDPQTNIFFPFGELEPGDICVFKLSRNFGEEWSSIGTGTGTSPTNNTLRVKAYGAACMVQIDALEK